MMRIFLFATFVLGGFFTNAQVINYAVDDSFNSGLIFTRGQVRDLMPTMENKYFVSGTFFQPTAQVQSSAILNVNGQLSSIVDIGNLYIAEYNQGYLRFGYDLLSHFYVTDDVYFSDFEFEFQKQAYSGPLNNLSLDILANENDQILVAGRFFTDSTLIGTSTSTDGLRQLCMIDSTGGPVPDFPMLRCAEPVDAAIYSIDSLSTGGYIIAGQFTEVGGYAYNNIAKLNSDFTVDTTFTSPFAPQGVLGISLIDSQDRLWVSGTTNLALQSDPDQETPWLRLLPSGEIDSSFSKPVLQTLTGANEDVLGLRGPNVVLQDEDSTFILGGNFVYVSGNYHKTLVKIHDDGSVIENAFTGLGADSAIWGNWEPSVGQVAGTHISNITKLPEGKLLLGGRFSSFGGEPYSCLVRLEPDGFVGLEEKEARGRLKVYPNPADGFIRVSLPNAGQNINQLSLYDLSGRLVRQLKMIRSEEQLDISGLKPGVYLLEGLSDQGRFTGKLMVE
jgi:hypothetical protein